MDQTFYTEARATLLNNELTVIELKKKRHTHYSARSPNSHNIPSPVFPG